MSNEIVKFLFIDSGSPTDQSHKNKLEKSLSAILSQSETVWFNCKPEALEQEESNRISNYIDICDVVGLMISDDFIHQFQHQGSDLYKLIKRLRERHDKEGVHLIPIIVRKNHGWQNLPLLVDLEPLPRDGKPISGSRKNQDNVRATIAQELEQLIVELIKYKQNLHKYTHQAFITFQKRLSSKERNRQLRELQKQLGIKKPDKVKSQRVVKAALSKSSESYKNAFRKEVFKSYPLNDSLRGSFVSWRKELLLIDEYAEAIESQVFDEYQRQVEYKQEKVEYEQEQAKQQQTLQESQQEGWKYSDFLVAGSIGLVVLGVLLGSPHAQNPPNQQSNPTSNQIQSEKSDGWVWLGAINGRLNSILADDLLEIKVSIHPPYVPSKGAVVRTLQDIRLRTEAGFNNQQIGIVKANEKIYIVRIKPLTNQNDPAQMTEVWAEIRKSNPDRN